jgi:hypothetical protein
LKEEILAGSNLLNRTLKATNTNVDEELDSSFDEESGAGTELSLKDELGSRRESSADIIRPFEADLVLNTEKR